MSGFLSTTDGLFFKSGIESIKNDTVLEVNKDLNIVNNGKETGEICIKADKINEFCQAPEVKKEKYKQIGLAEFCRFFENTIATPSSNKVIGIEFCIKGKIMESSIYLSKIERKETKLIENIDSKTFEIPEKCIKGAGFEFQQDDFKEKLSEDLRKALLNQNNSGQKQTKETNPFLNMESSQNNSGQAQTMEVKQNTNNFLQTMEAQQNTNPFLQTKEAQPNPFLNNESSEKKKNFGDIMNNFGDNVNDFFNDISLPSSTNNTNNTNYFSNKFNDIFNSTTSSARTTVESRDGETESNEKPKNVFTEMVEKIKNQINPTQENSNLIENFYAEENLKGEDIFNKNTDNNKKIKDLLAPMYVINQYMQSCIDHKVIKDNFGKLNVDALLVRNYLTGVAFDSDSIRKSIINNLDKIDKDSVLYKVLEKYASNEHIEFLEKIILGFKKKVTTKELFNIINPSSGYNKTSFGKDLSMFRKPLDFLIFIKNINDKGKKRQLFNTISDKEFITKVDEINHGYNKSNLSSAYEYMGFGKNDTSVDYTNQLI